MKAWASRYRRQLLFTAAAVAVWNFVASLVFCHGIDRMDAFSFPFLQWVETAPYWHQMQWPPDGIDGWFHSTRIWLVLSGLFPGVACAMVIFRVWAGRPAAKQPVFGASDWPTRREQEAGGITRRRF